MNIIHSKTIQLLIGILCLISTSITAQIEIWPGDVNDNGVVNNVDLVYLSQALGQTGIPRDLAEQNTLWYGHPYTLWGDDFLDLGIDLAFADTNGDGFIDEEDYDAIYDNNGQTHGEIDSEIVITTAESTDPAFELIELPFPGPFNENDIVIFVVKLADANGESLNYNGLAFSVKFDPMVLDPEQIQFNFETTEPTDETFSFGLLQGNNPDLGILEIAIGRGVDDPLLSSGDMLGSLIFIIEDDLVDFTQPEIQSLIQIQDIFMLNEAMEITPVNGDSITVVVVNDDIVAETEPSNGNELLIYPNPSKNNIQLTSTKLPIEKIRLHNIWGQEVLSREEINSSTFDLKRENLLAGVYFLTIQTKEGFITEKIYFLD